MTSHAADWKQKVEPYLQSFHAVAAEPLEGDFGELVIGGRLGMGLELVYVGHQELARRFFEHVAAAAETALRSETLKDDALFPGNRGEIRVDLVIARGFLTEETDRSLFLQASTDLEERTTKLARFDHIDREDYLWSIRCALIGGDAERATDLVKRGWAKIRRHEEAAILRKLAARDQSVLPLLDDYFDRARAPMANVVTSGHITHPIELAVLHDQLVHPEKPPDWWGAAARAGA